MPSPNNLRTLEAIRRSSMHQSMATASSSIAMVRYRAAAVTDPAKALDLVRSLVQKEITEKIGAVLSEYVDEFFGPAIENAKRNSDVIGNCDVINAESLLEEVCLNALEAAKAKYRKTTALTTQSGTVVHLPSNPSLTIEPTVLSINRGVKRKATSSANGGYPAGLRDERVANLMTSSPVARPMLPQQPSNIPPRPAHAQSQPSTSSHPSLIQRSNSSDLILITKQGKPVRREGPSWEPSRLTAETTFILGSRANKALGLGQTRGRLYMKHPELFKYSGDTEDKEWLTKNHVMSTTGGKAYLMVLQDIVSLSGSDEYASSPKLQSGELQGGFKVPSFMLAKMRTFMASVRTDPTASDDALLAVAARAAAAECLEQPSANAGLVVKRAAAPSFKLAATPAAGTSAQPAFLPAAAASAVAVPAPGELYVATPPEGLRDETGLEDVGGGGGGLEDGEDCEVAGEDGADPVSPSGVESGVANGSGGGAIAHGSDLFLHGMNLNSLVEELEKTDPESSGILSLAEDDEDEAAAREPPDAEDTSCVPPVLADNNPTGGRENNS